MNIIPRFLLSALITILCMPVAQALSTLEDPYPIMGDPARSIAGTAAVNSTMDADQTINKDMRKRRALHVEQAKNCRERAAKLSGDARRAAKRKCAATLRSQKNTWYR